MPARLADVAYHVVTSEPTTASGEGISSPFVMEDAALGFARDLIEDGVEVLRIENDAGAVARDADAVKAWCAARKRRRAGP